MRVIDASVALAWQFERADRSEASLAARVLADLPDTGAAVPAIWHLELANSMLRGERTGLCTSAQTVFFFDKLMRTNIETDETAAESTVASTVLLARRHSLTAYDAAYLELALRLGLELATFDKRLAVAARAAGVRVVGDGV